MKGRYVFSIVICILTIIILTLWFLGYFDNNKSPAPQPISNNEEVVAPTTIDPSLCVSKPNNPTFCNKPLKSPNEQCSLKLESTGNLVIYNQENKVWQTHTANIGFFPFRTILELNGNFVLYDSSFNGKNGEILWQTKTENQGTPPYFVKLLDNCNLLLEDSSGSELWRGIKNNQVKIKGKVSEKCIFSNLDASNNFGQMECSGNNIKFITEYNSNNNFYIKNKVTNKCLYSNATEIGHKICGKGLDEYFVLDNERIKNTQTNKCLISDINGLSQADCNTNENQKFILDNI